MIYLIIYGGAILLGLFFGFSLKGILIACLGGAASLIADFVFKDRATANIISYVVGAIATYFFIVQETS